MRKVLLPLVATGFLLVNHSTFASPSVSGNTISWPASDWYQVQRPDRQGQNPVDWNVCNSNADGTSCTVPNGTYRVKRQGGSPWRTLQVYDPVIVPSGGSSTTAPTVSGNRISWPSSGWYQVQRRSRQGQHSVDWDVCNTRTHGTSCTVPDGTYHVNRQGGSPWRVLQTYGPLNVGSGGYRVVWSDDFSGTSVSSKFYVPNWTSSPRDAVNQRDACSQSNGKLILSVKQVGNRRHACYLISKKRDFGPGDNKTLKIEFKANVSQVKARGAWFAGWIYRNGLNSSGIPYANDGNLNTGSEYDVFEYMPTNRNGFNTAIHDGRSYERWIYPLGAYGIDITRNAYHTYAVEWNKSCIAFFIDGKRVFKNTNFVSKAKVHNIMLTMEAQTGKQWGYWDVGNFANNLAANPAVGRIDWVKVSEKNSVDTSACN